MLKGGGARRLIVVVLAQLLPDDFTKTNTKYTPGYTQCSCRLTTVYLGLIGIFRANLGTWNSYEFKLGTISIYISCEARFGGGILGRAGMSELLPRYKSHRTR